MSLLLGEGIRFCGVFCAPGEAVPCWNKLQNMAFTKELVFRWTEFGCPGQHVSPPFALGLGVRQGSVLSPALFLLIMDPLLRQLQALSIGASVNNMYAGGFLHADDLYTSSQHLYTGSADIFC